jgi:hypothetical protein
MESDLRPPVFKRQFRCQNVLVNDNDRKAGAVLGEIEDKDRHLQFGSMKSSQALAQSVFGNLKDYGKLHLLDALLTDDGRPLLISGPLEKCSMEHEIDYLGELPGRTTNVDVYLESAYRVAVECKLSEAGIGSCSRPRLTPKNPRYSEYYCNGSYKQQCGRSERCSLASEDIQYWIYIPHIFNWPSDMDYDECPLRCTYQLVRNILAVAVQDGVVNSQASHAVLLYDKRNPAFQ